MMEMYLAATQPAGLRMWQTSRAFYPAQVSVSRAQEERQKCVEKLMKNAAGGSNIGFGPLEVHTVYPYMWPPDFEQFMIERGPQAWRLAFDTWPVNTAKSLLLMVLSRPRLELYFQTVLSMYDNEKTFLATRIYEVGVASQMRQLLLPESTEVSYYKLMNPASQGRPLGVVPVLKDEKNFPPAKNKSLVMNLKFLAREPVYDLTGKSPDEVFVARLFCASFSAKANRWPECWAHSLSALDHTDGISEETKRRFLHDLFCLIAHSAGRCFIRSVIAFKALEVAHGHMHNLEHPWKRLLVFQDLLVHWGFFTLEEKVFEKGMEIIPLKTDYSAQLIHQHLKALMHRVENILLYQYTRQKFHWKCDARTCKKPQRLTYSYLRAEELTEKIDFWSRTLKEAGDREYYSGYVHVYTALRFSAKKLRDGLNHLEQAKFYFDRCETLMRTRHERKKDAGIMSNYLSKNRTNTLDKLVQPFNTTTMMEFNSGAAEIQFRMLLVSCYFGTQFYTMQAETFQERVAEYYHKTTQDRGYRQDLLEQCQREAMPRHKDAPDLFDYPSVEACMEKEELDDVAARCYWRKELNGKLYPFTAGDGLDELKLGEKRKKRPTTQSEGAETQECKVVLEKMKTPRGKRPPPPVPTVVSSRRMSRLKVATMSTGGRYIPNRRKPTLTRKMLDFSQSGGNESSCDDVRVDDSDDTDYVPKAGKKMKTGPESAAVASTSRGGATKRVQRGRKKKGAANKEDDGTPDLMADDLPGVRNFLVFGGDILNFGVYVFGKQIAERAVQFLYN